MRYNGYLDKVLCFPRQADGGDDRGMCVGNNYCIHAEGALVYLVSDSAVR